MEIDTNDAQVSVLSDESERLLPPGGGLLLFVGASFLFWAIVLWAVL
jgi:hypothetical protein